MRLPNPTHRSTHCFKCPVGGGGGAPRPTPPLLQLLSTHEGKAMRITSYRILHRKDRESSFKLGDRETSRGNSPIILPLTSTALRIDEVMKSNTKAVSSRPSCRVVNTPRLCSKATQLCEGEARAVARSHLSDGFGVVRYACARRCNAGACW
jgi:hypothetical protein